MAQETVKTSVLITGALGFVGRYLYGELAESGYEVWASDLACLCENAEPPFDSDKVRACDVTKTEGTLTLLRELTPDAIVHLAAQSSSSKAFKHPKETFVTNALGTLNVFEGVRSACPGCTVLVVGSADAYGPQPGETSLGEDSPFFPVSPYALSKAVQDLIGLQYWRGHGIRAFRTRSFNHTGPGQTTTFALPSFASQIAAVEAGRSEPVIEAGNLDVVRDFLDVRDVVRAYRLILERGEPGEAYNICSGKPIRMEKLLELLVSFSRTKIAVRKVQSRMRPADIPYLVGDNSKLKAHTGWQPHYEIEQTLSELLTYWRARVKESAESSTQKKEAR